MDAIQFVTGDIRRFHRREILKAVRGAFGHRPIRQVLLSLAHRLVAEVVLTTWLVCHSLASLTARLFIRFAGVLWPNKCDQQSPPSTAASCVVSFMPAWATTLFPSPACVTLSQVALARRSQPALRSPLDVVVVGSRFRGVDTFLGIPYATIPRRFAYCRRFVVNAASHDDEGEGGPTRRGRSLPCTSAEGTVVYQDGVVNAEGPQICPQGVFLVAVEAGALGPIVIRDLFRRGHVGSEFGCLTVNIWRPSEPSEEENVLSNGARKGGKDDGGGGTVSSRERLMPVLVFIHGGGFLMGHNQQSPYDGFTFAKRNRVVVVAINYRLGIMGFLHAGGAGGSDGVPASSLSRGSNSASLGLQQGSIDPNCGLADQLEALRWIRENIARFGGDPDRVTISGHSAGSFSVSTLMSMRPPNEERLFHRVILFSGAACQTMSHDMARDVAQVCTRFANERIQQRRERQGRAASGGPPDLRAVTIDALGDHLRTLTVPALIRLQQDVCNHFGARFRSGAYAGRLPFAPCIDGAVLPVHPLAAIRDGVVHRYRRQQPRDAKALPQTEPDAVPLFVITTDHEYCFFTCMARLLDPRAMLLQHHERARGDIANGTNGLAGDHREGSMKAERRKEESSMTLMPLTDMTAADRRLAQLVAIGVEKGRLPPDFVPCAMAAYRDPSTSPRFAPPSSDQPSSASRREFHPSNPHPLYDAVMSDWLFRAPSEAFATAYAQSGAATSSAPNRSPTSSSSGPSYCFMARCDFTGTPSRHMGPAHYVDIPLYFGNQSLQPMFCGRDVRADVMSSILMTDVAHFVRHGCVSVVGGKSPLGQWKGGAKSCDRPLRVYHNPPWSNEPTGIRIGAPGKGAASTLLVEDTVCPDYPTMRHLIQALDAVREDR